MKRIVLLLVFAVFAYAQPQQRPPDLPLTADERTRIIENVADRIERMYVDPAKAKEIAAKLRAELKRGSFDKFNTALDLVPPMNRALIAASGDKHIGFGYGAKPDPRPLDAPEPPETPEERAQRVRDVARNGFGIHGVQRLEGNVGLLTWMKFHEPDVAGDAVATAMRLLSGTDALIIDLRNSDGGSPQMVQLLVSYFVPDVEPVHAFSIYDRPTDATRQYWTLPYVPGPRYAGKDVYILTSSRTWSAGEGFTDHMKRLKLATVVGEVTKGGAHPSMWVRVHPNFGVKVPVARAFDPITGEDWEGKGITPDVAVPEKEALRTAHLMAIRRLREKAADDDTKEFLDWSLGNIEKQ